MRNTVRAALPNQPATASAKLLSVSAARDQHYRAAKLLLRYLSMPPSQILACGVFALVGAFAAGNYPYIAPRLLAQGESHAMGSLDHARGTD